MKELLTDILKEVREHSKRFDAIDKRLDSHDQKFISIDKQFEKIRAEHEVFHSKLDEHGQMLRALLDVNQVRKAQLDAHEMRLSKVEGTIKGQATLALDELAKA